MTEGMITTLPTGKMLSKNLTDQTYHFRRNHMPAGKGTYGSKKGRPPAKGKKKINPKLAKLPPKVAAAITRNMNKKKK